MSQNENASAENNPVCMSCLFLDRVDWTFLNPKGCVCGGVQKCPVVRRLSLISLRVTLWSQTFLTSSINIPTRRYTANVYMGLLGDQRVFLQYLQGNPCNIYRLQGNPRRYYRFSLQILQKPPVITP